MELDVYHRDLERTISVRSLLHELLAKIWKEVDQFDGKRPWENRDWKLDFYVSLVKAGVISGGFNEEGELNDYDKVAGEDIMLQAIAELCRKPS